MSEIACPCCSGPLRPSVLVCDACNVRVEGRFAANEFASLPAEDLHLLRIFVRYEGRIRDMESALGLSYPTIKLRLAELRRKLALAPQETADVPGSADADAAAPQPPSAPATVPGPQPLTAAPAPDRDEAAREQERGREGEGDSVEAILAALEAKRMSFQDAMRRLQQRRQR